MSEEEIELLDYTFDLAIGECYSDEIDEISKLQKKVKSLNNIINDIDRYIHNWKLEDVGEKTMLILNDILLIKNGMSNEVIRLKGSNKE